MIETTRLRPSWRNRTTIFVIVLLAFGLWGAYDASIAYPARGKKVAQKLEHNYLVMAKRGDDARRLLADEVSVPDPRAVLDRLKERSVSQDPPLSELEASRLRWLESLPVVGLLSEENTVYVDAATNEPDNPRDPNVRFAELDERWAGVSPPKPLHEYDLLFQWIIFVVCWALGLMFLGTMVMTMVKKYRWDTQTRTLTLPSGESISPDDLADIDKRKWHKFFVFLTIAPSHPTLGGKTLKIDLFRRDRLEGWILEMEQAAFPDRAKDDQTEAADAPAHDDAPDDPSQEDQAAPPADH